MAITLPAGGVDGQPLLAGGATGAAWGNEKQLVPTDGIAGQLVVVGPDGNTILQTRDAGTAVSLPLDFTDGAKHTVYSMVIPGGALGPNGFVRVRAVAQLTTTAGARTATFAAEVSAAPFLASTTASMPAGAHTYCPCWDVLFKNANVDTSQDLFWEHTVTDNGVWYSAASIAGVGGIGLDTRSDWQVDFTIQASAAVTGAALFQLIHVEYGYIA